MKPVKSVIAVISILSMTFISTQAFSSSGTSKYVKKVSLSLPGMAAIINIQNQSVDKLLSSLNLKVKTSSMTFDVSGSGVVCKGSKVEFIGSKAHFGTVGIMNDGKHINEIGSMYDKSKIDVSVLDSDHDVAEAGHDTFTVPLSSVKNGHPALRVNALDELSKKLQQFIQGGGKEIDFYKQDQEIVLKRPISLTGSCRKKNDTNKASVGYETKNHTIQIKYKGDPELVKEITPVLNAQLQGNLPNQVNNIFPFKLDNATFQLNMLTNSRPQNPYEFSSQWQ